MKILFLHPYEILGDWNHRLARQVELMSQKCDLKIVTEKISPIPGVTVQFRERIAKEIKEFKPDVVYAVGFLLGYTAIRSFDRVVYDMGSFISRNIAIQEKGYSIPEMLSMTDRELLHVLRYSRKADFYEKEKYVLETVNTILCREGLEFDLLQKIFNVWDKVALAPLAFSDLPKPIPFEKKLNRVIAISPKWGDREKNFALIQHISEEIPITTIGHGGNYMQSLSHDKLMDELNKSKVLYCPYLAGGCGVVSEGLKLGCNVVTHNWYPFNAHVNDELITQRRGEVSTLKRAMEKYYPLKKEFPSEEDQINQILEECQKIYDKI